MTRMKNMPKLITSLVLALFVSPFAWAADGHDHQQGHQQESKQEQRKTVRKGPNGGRIIQSKAGFALEVSIDKQRIARLVFLDAENKAVALQAQNVSGIAGDRSAPTKLGFIKGTGVDENVLLADKPLPAGEHLPIILSIKITPDSTAVTERIELHLH